MTAHAAGPAGEIEATVTSKGQITIPKRVRDRLGIRTGDRIAFREKRGGAIYLEKRRDVSGLKQWRGHFKDLKGRDPDELIEEWRGR